MHARRSTIPRAALVAIVAAAFLVGGGSALGVVAPHSLPSSQGGSSAVGGAAFPALGAGAACNSPSYISSSSLLITLPGPSTTLRAGGNLTVTFQFGVKASKVSTAGMNVTFPSVFATFPLSSGTQQVYFPVSKVPIPLAGWSASASMNKTLHFPSAVPFKAGSNATLSSQKLAVMAPTNYTTLTLQFRWSWSIVQPDGTTVQSGWSTPNASDHSPAQLRSIFYPAPLVTFLWSSGSSATIGTNYTATLGGSVAGRYFLLEMEFPSTGKVVQAQGQTAPTSAGTFGVFIPVLGYARSLSPGGYLVHIHDACGALLYNKSIHAVFASSATIQFVVSPVTCSTKFNGTNRFNGSSGIFPPSITPYPMSVGCVGHTFKSWSGTGGLHVNNGSSLRVSAGGTFTVVYT